MKQTMHHYNFDDVVASLTGAFFSLFIFFLKIDWHMLMQEGGKVFEGFIIGVCGGVGGYLGKKFIHQFFKNKNDKNVRKN